MKRSILIRFIVVLSVISFAFSGKKPVRVIFFGDSITQAGTGPVGYITKLKKMAEDRGLASEYELIGAGIGGNKVYDLYLRLEEDVIAKQPDVVFIYVGINDVWHKASHGTGTDPDKFVKFYEAIIAKLKAKGVKVILCTPSVIGEKTDASNQQDGDLNYYSTLIRELAEKEKLELCDLRKIFLDALTESNPNNRDRNILTTDRVHLNEMGNELVARSFGQVLFKK